MPRSCFYEFVLLKQTIFCSLQPLSAPARYSIVVVVVVCVCVRVCVLRKIVQHQHIENCHFMGFGVGGASKTTTETPTTETWLMWCRQLGLEL